MRKPILIRSALLLLALLLWPLLSPPQAQAWPWTASAPNPHPKPHKCTTCTASEAGYELVKRYEGFVPVKYIDAAGFPTIGYGHLIRPGEVFEGALSPERAKALLVADMRTSERGVNKLVGPPLWQHQFDALVSFTFNLGEARLKSSTLLKRVNAERHDDAVAEFGKWVYAGGKRLLGLVLRRAAEAGLYSGTASQT